MSMVTLVLKLAKPETNARSNKSNSVLIWSEKNLNNKQTKVNRQTNSDTLMMSRCLQERGLTQGPKTLTI